MVVTWFPVDRLVYVTRHKLDSCSLRKNGDMKLIDTGSQLNTSSCFESRINEFGTQRGGGGRYHPIKNEGRPGKISFLDSLILMINEHEKVKKSILAKKSYGITYHTALLGLTWNSDASWKSHLSSIITKASKYRHAVNFEIRIR